MKLAMLVNKALGAGLLLASMAFLAQGRAPMLLPGLLFALGGFWLVARRERADEPVPSDLQERVERLEDATATAQVELGNAQKQIDQLLEEREFMRQLLAGSSSTGVPVRADS